MNTDRPRHRSGPKNINWLMARTMFMDGKSVSEIARAISVRREGVSRRCSAEKWREQRDRIGTSAAQKIEAEAVESNASILRRHEKVSAKLLTVAENRLDKIIDGSVPFDSNELRNVQAVISGGTLIQRAARGILPNERQTDGGARPFVIELRDMPPSLEEFEILKAFREQKTIESEVAS